MTASRTATSAPLVGVVNLPALADLLRQGGYDVVADADTRTGATDIRSALTEFGAFPIFISNEYWAGINAWIRRIATETTVVVVDTSLGDGTDFGDDVHHATVPAPAPVVLAAGRLGIDASFHHIEVFVDGSIPGYGVVEEPEVEPEVVEELPVPVPAALAAPIPVPVPVPVVAPPAAAPVFVAEPAPTATLTLEEPVIDEEDDGFYGPATPQVTPVVEEPVAPPAPVFTVPEIEEVFIPLVEPEPVTPTAAVFTVPEIETPVVVAPEVAPVFVVPVVEPELPAAEAQTAPLFTVPVTEEPLVTESGPEPSNGLDNFTGVRAVSESDRWEATRGGVMEFPTTAPPVILTPQFEPVAPPAPVFTVPEVETPAFEVPVIEPEPVQPTPQAPSWDEVPVLQQPVAPAYEAPQTYLPVEPQIELPPIAPQVTADNLADVIICFAGKGGVGKSTSSVGIAQLAAEAGLRVVLVDANVGQGDLRTFLRLGAAGLPSIHNFAVDHNFRGALLDPQTLNAARDIKQDPLKFALVQAPPAHIADTTVVTPEVYYNLVQQARAVCDLVVIDTQIIEAVDQFGMVDRFIMPLLREPGGYGVGLADLSSPGITNLLSTLKRFAASGVDQSRLMSMVNRIPTNIEFNFQGLVQSIGEHSTVLGLVYADTAIPDAMNRGRAAGTVTSIAAVLGKAITEVRPTAQLPAVAHSGTSVESTQKQKATRKGGLFGRRGK